MASAGLKRSLYGGAGFTMRHAWGLQASMPMDPHFHDEYVINSQIVGCHELSIGGKTELCGTGETVLLNPYQVHTCNDSGSTNLEYVCLYIERSVVRQLAAELGSPEAEPQFTVTKVADHQVLAAGLFELLDLARQQKRSPRSRRDSHVVTATTSAMTRALHRVTRHALEQYSTLRRPMWRSTNRIGHHKIARSVDFIRSVAHDDATEGPNLDALARIAGLSKFHFLRQFTQVVGMTPGAYLRTLRVCRATEMLRVRRLPISAVATSVGFADHPSFRARAKLSEQGRELVSKRWCFAV